MVQRNIPVTVLAAFGLLMIVMILATVTNGSNMLKNSQAQAQTDNVTEIISSLTSDTTNNNNNLTVTLGDLIIDGIDRPTVIRVLDANGPILEKSYIGNATILGNTSATYFGTLTTHPRSEGSTYSEGQAVIMTEDGEMIAHVSQGIGGYDFVTGKLKNHGSTFFSTNSTGGKLGFLNNMVGIWADEIDPVTGIAHAKTWLLDGQVTFPGFD